MLKRRSRLVASQYRATQAGLELGRQVAALMIDRGAMTASARSGPAQFNRGRSLDRRIRRSRRRPSGNPGRWIA